jgi:mono/diheme cytochrome c family protein
MRRFLIAVFVLALPLAAASTRAQDAPAPGLKPGDPAAGKVHYTFGNTSCSNCHGITGEGRFGPPLAGRNLTYARFRAYVRNPLGRMVAYPASELNDQEIADMVAYFNSLPASEKTMIEWRTPLPKMAPRGQQLMVGVLGCGQCHGATITTPRHGAAEVSGDFEWFKRQVYQHTTAQRRGTSASLPGAIVSAWATTRPRGCPRRRCGRSGTGWRRISVCFCRC